MAERKEERKSSWLGQILSTFAVLAVLVIAIEGYHRWKKHNLEQTDPLGAAQQELASAHRERTIAWSKLAQFDKNRPTAPNLQIRAGNLAEKFATEIVAAEEQFAAARDKVRDLGGRWVLFGPVDDELVPLSDEKRIASERNAAAARIGKLTELAAAYPGLKSRIDPLVAGYEREVEYWSE